MKVILFLILFMSRVVADDVTISVNPENPIAGESFEVKFSIKTDVDDEPIINFDPFGVEVVDRSGVSTSTRITYINGKSSMIKTMGVTYELTAPRIGSAYLRDIKIEIGDKKLTHPTIMLNILKTPRQAKKIFVRAELDKESVFIGESFVVRYYLYHLNTVNLSSFDIKKFPKLDKFLKRFHQENLSPERVRYKNRTYIRRIMYTAQLFADREGKFKVDPLVLKVRYGSQGQNPLSNFGFAFSTTRMRTSTISSKNVDVEVMSLPSQGMPPHFTGLVGQHKFSLSQNKNKFITNEPIELQLVVSGKGALELFQAPGLLNDSNLEEFEKNSDFEIKSDFTSEKKINYTYLGRGSVSLSGQTIPLSYFDPDTKTYITEELKVGDIIVISAETKPGTDGQASRRGNSSDCESKSNLEVPSDPKKSSLVFGPMFKPVNSFIYFTRELFWIFLLSSLSLLGYIAFRLIKKQGTKELSLMENIFQNGISYQNLHKLLSQNSGVGMEQTVKELSLSDACREYFLSLVDLMNKFFASEGSQHKVAVNKKHFKELEKALKIHEETSTDH